MALINEILYGILGGLLIFYYMLRLIAWLNRPPQKPKKPDVVLLTDEQRQKATRDFVYQARGLTQEMLEKVLLPKMQRHLEEGMEKRMEAMIDKLISERIPHLDWDAKAGTWVLLSKEQSHA